MNRIIDVIELFILRVIIRHRMRAYPYGPPHPETVKAIERGICAVIDLSNARPEKYADEPWLAQSAFTHVDHCVEHARRAKLSFHPWKGYWQSDLGQPEIVHACLRAMFCLYRHRKEHGGLYTVTTSVPD